MTSLVRLASAIKLDRAIGRWMGAHAGDLGEIEL
jgi:hypothetical protein